MRRRHAGGLSSVWRLMRLQVVARTEQLLRDGGAGRAGIASAQEDRLEGAAELRVAEVLHGALRRPRGTDPALRLVATWLNAVTAVV